jgi:competence protein ComEC
MRHSLFYSITGGFTGGILCASLFSFPLTSAFILCLVASAACGYFILNKQIFITFDVEKYSYVFLISVISMSASVGILRYCVFERNIGDEVLLTKADEQIEAEGIITEEPDEREQSVKLVIELKNIILYGNNISLQSTKILAEVEPYSHFLYGDKIKIVGKLQVPRNFKDETGREFNYKAYLGKDGIFYIIQKPQITLIAHHEASWLKECLLTIKKFFIQKLDENIPAPESRLAAGLTIAGKRALPKTLQQEFQQTGTVQVVVLSGYNVTIIAEAVSILFSFFPLVFSSTISILAILLFTIAAGGSATIVRGSIMAIIVILGKFLRRRYDVLRALIITGICMLALNPMLLVFDPSFQLSFLATLGLILISPCLKKYLTWIPEKYLMREIGTATFSAQLGVLPFLVFASHTFSLVSIPANFLVSLFVPATMLACFMTGIAGIISFILAIPFSWLAFGLLRFELAIVHFFVGIPLGSITRLYFPWWVMFLCYAGYGVILRHLHRRETTKPPTIQEIKSL